MRMGRVLTAYLALLVLLLAACGGARPPQTMDALPVFPEASELPAGANPLAEQVSEAMLAAIGANLSAEVRLLQLPAGSDWASVEQFYREELADTDWQIAEELTSAEGSLTTAGWQRGALAGEQVLMLGYLPASPDAAPVLIVALFSE